MSRGLAAVAFRVCVVSLGRRRARLVILALDPHPVHGELFASVHLQPSVHEVLPLFEPGLGKQAVKLI